MATKSKISCNLCGENRFEMLYPDELADRKPKLGYDFSTETMKTHQMVRCSACGHIYANPMPRFIDDYETTEDQVYVRSSKQRRKTYDRLLVDILKFKEKGRLLDIGCATGILMDAAAPYFDVEGIELSKWAADRASIKHRVYTTPLRETNLANNTYDIITLMGVIEHFSEPLQEISAISKLLSCGGLLVIYTGDVEAWLPKMLGKRWWWYQGMHLNMFSYRTCCDLMLKCGLRILKHRKHTTYFSLASLSISLNRYPFGRIFQPILNLPGVKDIVIPVTLSGEMLLFAQKGGEIA